jgi:uncharacterized phage protein (TIGR02220 family)
VRYFVIPETFFKSIAEKGKLYSRIWFHWLSEYVDEIFNQDFIEKEIEKYPNIKEIREIHEFGVQLLQQEFKIIDKKVKKVVSKENKEVAVKVLEYLNIETGSKYSSKKGSNIELISARINEGYSFEDFKIVIDKKIKDWKGTDWEKYLRPLTLFSKTKFENYLNAINESGTKNNFGKFADSIRRAKEIIGLRREP